MEEAATKKKRKQLTACDPCRLRRVKCVREPEDADECNGCRLRGYTCSKVFVSQQARKLDREGRLGQARRLFGKQESEQGLPVLSDNGEGPSVSQGFGGDSCFAESPGDIDIINSIGSSTANNALFEVAAPLWSFSSPEGRLQAIQTNEFVANSLVHDYGGTLLGNSPFLPDFHEFLTNFERAGRRISQLSNNDQVNLTLILALASRITDVPVIAGAGAPSAALIRRAHKQIDLASLRQFGANRDAICRAIEGRARERVANHYLNAEPTIESAAALVTLSTIAIPDAVGLGLRKTRIYGAAALEHIRTVHLEQPGEGEQLRRLFRILLASDALFGMDTGRPAHISDEDIFNMLPHAFDWPPKRVLAEMATLPPREAFGCLVESSCMLARNFKARFYTALSRARLGPPSLDDYRSMQEDILTLLKAGKLMQAGATDYHALQVLRALQLGGVSELVMLEALCKDALERDMFLELLPEWSAFRTELQRTIKEEVLELSELAERLLTDGMTLGNNLSWVALTGAAEVLLTIGAEQISNGSTEEATRSLKGCDNFLACLQSLAFSWPDIGGAVSAGSNSAYQLDLLENRLADLKLQHSASTLLSERPDSDDSFAYLADALPQQVAPAAFLSEALEAEDLSSWLSTSANQPLDSGVIEML